MKIWQERQRRCDTLAASIHNNYYKSLLLINQQNRINNINRNYIIKPLDFNITGKKQNCNMKQNLRHQNQTPFFVDDYILQYYSK